MGHQEETAGGAQQERRTPPGAGRLLEREGELDSLLALIDAAAAGDGRLALVEGPAGIGKTRLVAEGRALAVAAGLRVLSARGGELERQFPFGVVRQLFESLLIDDEAREQALAGSARTARAVFELAGDDDGAGDSSFAALHGLYWLTVNLSERTPVVLAIDDLHWCDSPSLRFAAYLLHRLEGLPVLVLASLRPAEPGSDSALLGELASDPLTVSLPLRPLSAPAVAEVVRDRLGEGVDAAFSSACETATGGNPLLLSELLKGLRAEAVPPDARHVDAVGHVGPRAASRTVLLRLARLSGDAVGVARAVAVLGEGADPFTVGALTGLDEVKVARAVAALVRAEVLRDEQAVGFVHPLVRDAVYQDVPAGERALQHDHAARLLADAGAAAERVAAHLLAVPPRGAAWVVDALRTAAASARQKGAAESAVAYLTRALAEPPAAPERVGVLLDLGLAEALTGARGAAEHLSAARAALPDAASRGRATLVLAKVLVFSGRPAEAAAVAAEAARDLGTEHADLRSRLEVSRLSVAAFDPGSVRLDEAVREAEHADLDADGAGARMFAGGGAYLLAMRNVPAARCVDLALRAVGDRTLIAADNGGAAVTGAITTLALADHPEALATCDAALSAAHRRGSLTAAVPAHFYRGVALWMRGELAEAAEMLETGFEEVRLWGNAGPHLFSAAFLAEIEIERGDMAAAQSALDRAGLAPDPPPSPQASWWLIARLHLLVLERRWEEALAAAADCARRLDGVISNPAWAPWRSWEAQALAATGRTEAALGRADDELELARVWGAPRALGRALRVRGTILRDEGIDELRAAVSATEGSLARLEHARSLAALGTALRLARRPTDARDPLRRALELAGACGAQPLAEHARSELRASGARPRRDELSGVGSLTASERRVADLAAEGRTNREIAQALFVTPKTVEVHLSNAYRKLDIRSRRELAGALGE